MQTHEPPYLRLVVGRMYAVTKSPKFLPRDFKLAGEASAALCAEIRERGWPMPPNYFRAEVGTGGSWPAIFLSASMDGVTWSMPHGFGFTTRRIGDVTDADAFADVFKAHGLT